MLRCAVAPYNIHGWVSFRPARIVKEKGMNKRLLRPQFGLAMTSRS